MDVNDLRSLVMLVAFGLFVGIAAWAWARRNQPRFDEAARLPFDDHGRAAFSINDPHGNDPH
jgi:cytochrome c oxidase cbb3-type subunit IV